MRPLAHALIARETGTLCQQRRAQSQGAFCLGGWLMAYVKLDTRILNSTLWLDRDTRDVFITALLMAEPMEFTEPQEQIEVRSLQLTGLIIPPGWYGFVPAAGVGIAHRAMVDREVGLTALEHLSSPDPESRSLELDGRRLLRVSGGYIIVNYMAYRDKDHTAAERQQRLRDRKRHGVTSQSNGVTSVTRYAKPSRHPVTSRIADADADAEKGKDISDASHPQGAGKPPPAVDEGRFPDFWRAWPKTDRKQDRKKCLAKWKSKGLDLLADRIIEHVEAMKATSKWRDGYDPLVMTYLNGDRWQDPIPPDREYVDPKKRAAREQLARDFPLISAMGEHSQFNRNPEGPRGPTPMEVLDELVAKQKRIT